MATKSFCTSNKAKNRNLYSWAHYCKTSKVKCRKVCNCWAHDRKTISVHHHIDLQFLHLVLQNTHGTAPTGWQCLFFLCKIVHSWAVNTHSPPRKVQNQQVYCWVCYCKRCFVVLVYLVLFDFHWDLWAHTLVYSCGGTVEYRRLAGKPEKKQRWG